MGTDIRIALTLFTVLSPAGAIAFIALALQILRRSKRDNTVVQLEHYLVAPLAVCMVGLIASATHLGTPANALYVIKGWGRSPLSNEVVAAAGFLFLAGSYWLYSFSAKHHVPRLVARIWLGLTCASAVWLVSMISVVYAIPTIPTWHNTLVPFGLWAVALCTGPQLAIAAFALAGATVSRGWLLTLLAVSALATVAGTVVFCLQNTALYTLHNAYGSAAALVPWYPWCIAGWAIFGLLGLAITGRGVFHLKKGRKPPASIPDSHSAAASSSNPSSNPAAPIAKLLRPALVGAILSMIAAACIRIPFYAMHITIGL